MSLKNDEEDFRNDLFIQVTDPFKKVDRSHLSYGHALSERHITTWWGLTKHDMNVILGYIEEAEAYRLIDHERVGSVTKAN
jgi:hypothetical protein